jgi:hypothetical protein
LLPPVVTPPPVPPPPDTDAGAKVPLLVLPPPDADAGAKVGVGVGAGVLSSPTFDMISSSHPWLHATATAMALRNMLAKHAILIIIIIIDDSEFIVHWLRKYT